MYNPDVDVAAVARDRVLRLGVFSGPCETGAGPMDTAGFCDGEGPGGTGPVPVGTTVPGFRETRPDWVTTPVMEVELRELTGGTGSGSSSSEPEANRTRLDLWELWDLWELVLE
jgi:hypothetical protein